MFGARRLTRLMIFAPFTSSISDNCALTRFDACRRKWLLPPLVRTTLPEPVRRKRLDVALWVFSLVLPLAFALRGIDDTPFEQISADKINRGTSYSPADFQHRWDLLWRLGLRFASTLLSTRLLSRSLLALFFLFGAAFIGSQHHEHRASFHLRRNFNRGDVCQSGGNFL